PPSPPPSRYDSARARAAEAAAADRFADAAAILEAALREYPDDFTLRLDLAYYLLRAQDYAKSAAAYRAALAISPAHPDAQAGLSDATLGEAWRDYKAGRSDEAQAGFESVIASARNVGSAREGISLVAPRTRFIPRIFGQG